MVHNFSSSIAATSTATEATKAGINILKNGGSAIDAVIAMQMVLNVVEPHASGIGGGAFMIYYDNKSKQIITYNGREIASSAATNEIVFPNQDVDSVVNYRFLSGSKQSIGVPGVVRMLKESHKDYGKLSWKNLFKDAINYAENGFKMSKRLNGVLNQLQTRSNNTTNILYKEFYASPENAILPVGSVIYNKPLAKVLEGLANYGDKYFYEGVIAKDIESQTGGYINIQDLQRYRINKGTGLSIKYRDYRIYTMDNQFPVLMAMNILQQTDLRKITSTNNINPKTIHIVAEAISAALLYRAKYLDYDSITNNKVDELLSSGKAKEIFNQINLEKYTKHHIDCKGEYLGSTTNFSAKDKSGNIAVVTSSINGYFGCGILTESGFYLNNTLYDFTPDKLSAINNVQAGKIPRSSMTPLIVFDAQDRPILSLGTAGGFRITSFLVQTLVSILDFGIPIQKAIDMPRYVVMSPGNIELEMGKFNADQKKFLNKTEWNITENNQVISGLTGFYIDYDKKLIKGGADKRRNGSAIVE